MVKPEIPANEVERLKELRSLGLLDSPGEERFDRITRLAQRLFGVSTVLVSLLDEDRQWFKSRVGLEVTETSRDMSFCGHAILSDDVLMVPDATKDGRFFDNPLVLGSPDIRFYAGCPISGPGGAKLGTLCLIDQLPRELSAEELESLRDLAEMVENEIATSNMAVTDSLTGLGNRRGFEMAAPLVLEINRRRLIDSVLIYFDLDKFKLINDTFSHSEGDHALHEFADLLRSVFRQSDVIARLGGDEFVVLLSGTSDYQAAVGRLKSALDIRNESGAHPYRLETSIGVATIARTENESLEVLLRRADEAMYLEKLAKD
jgi:diguanylate cyclase (GGDEF)-like protein